MTPTERWKQYLAEARTMLRNASGVNTRNGRMNPLGIQNVLDPLGLSSNSPRQGGVRTAYGTTPSEADVVRVATQLSGGWKPGQRRRGGGRQAGIVRRGGSAADSRRGGAEEVSALEALKNSFESRINEANKANLDRYNESHGELTDVRTRNQDRVGNWGKAAEADIDERLREAAGNVAANLAARGLGNSNIQGAFDLRAARDAARERQRVSEMRDDRASQYDTRDTNNLVNLIGQRNDIAPDYSLLVNLADRMGQADALKAFNEQRAAQPSYTPQPYYGVPNYTSPGGAYMRAPQTVNLFAGAMNNLPQFTSQPGIISNEYPTTSPRPFAPNPYDAGVERQVAAMDARGRRIQERLEAGYQKPRWGGITPNDALGIAIRAGQNVSARDFFGPR